MILKVLPPTSALDTAVRGLQQAEAQVAQAANTIQQGFAAVQTNLVPTAERPLVEDAMRAAVLPTDVDIVAPLVDLLQATIAYRTNVAVVRVTADVEETVIGSISRR